MARRGTVTPRGSQVKVTFSGPFFERDPSETFRQNVRKMLEGMAREGEAAVKSLYPLGPTGQGRAGVVGRTKSLSGKKWAMTAVISQQHVYKWDVKGGGVRAEAEYRGGKTEAKHHMFRRVATALRKSRAAAVADLTEGMN